MVEAPQGTVITYDAWRCDFLPLISDARFVKWLCRLNQVSKVIRSGLRRRRTPAFAIIRIYDHIYSTKMPDNTKSLDRQEDRYIH